MIDKKTKSLVKSLTDNVYLDLPQEEILSLAENNRVLFAISKQDISLGAIRVIGNSLMKKLSRTLEEIDNTLGKGSYRIVRTYKYIDYVTVDVDIFVDRTIFTKVVNRFELNGFLIESHDHSYGGRLKGMQVNIRKESFVTIDLHQDFTWQKHRFLDSKLVMDKPRTKKVANREILVPQPEVELLLCLADITHERFNITLLDLIWIEGLSKEIKNWDLVFNQVEEYKWGYAFGLIGKIVNQLGIDIYGKTLIPNIPTRNTQYSLPYFIPLFNCWRIYLDTLIYCKRLPIISFLYLHFNRLKYILTNKMPYYTPWYK